MIRPATLQRLDTDLLLARLRKAPDCAITRGELVRRGLGAVIEAVVLEEAHQRWLERADRRILEDELEDCLAGLVGGIA